MKSWGKPMVGCVLIVFIAIFVCCSEKADTQVTTADAGMAVSGEKITYAIKQLGIKAGEATLVYQGHASGEAEDIHLIVFTADGMNFYDQEKIYFNIQEFIPVRVERDLNIAGNKEKIVEHYEPEKNQIRIVKTVGRSTKEQVVKKEGPVDNIYCFIYRYRKNGLLAVNESLNLRLPTRDVVMKAVEQTKLKAGREFYEVCHLQSDPDKYHVWFDVGPKRMPLRIDGAVGFGKTSMIMMKYESQGE